MSKVRVVTISILLVAYLLVTTSQLLKDPAFQGQGQMDIRYTTPIDQNVTYTVDRVPFSSANSFVILNTSDMTLYNTVRGSLPRFDYDRIVFNLTLRPTAAIAEVTLRIWLEDVTIRASENITGTTTISLELNVSELKGLSDGWLFYYDADVLANEDVVIQNLVVWVYSVVPLVPVSFDVQSTDGSSFFDNSLSRNTYGDSPFLYLSKNNNSTNSDVLRLQTSNLTLYLRPGSLNGSAWWDDVHHYFPSLPFDVTFSLEEKVLIGIRMLLIRIDLDMDALYPITHVRISDGDYDIDVYVTSDMLPPLFYVPPIFSTSIVVELMNPNYVSDYRLASVYTASGRTNLNGTHNLHVDARFQHLTFQGIAATSDIILGALSITLFLLVLLRIGLAVHMRERTIRYDFRLIPFILYLAIAVIPWFSSTRVFSPNYQVSDITIHSLSMGPLPLVGFWVDGSSMVWMVTSEALYWSIVSMVLYWIPILLCTFRLGAQSDTQNDIEAAFVLFLPPAYALYVYFGLETTVGTPPAVLFPVWISCLIPVVWMAITAISSLTGRVTIGDLEVKPKMERAGVTECRASSELVRDEKSLGIQILDDFGSWRGYFVAVLFTLLLAIPCANGFGYRLYVAGVQYYYGLLPIISLNFIGSSHDYSQIGLASLLIGIPYFLAGSFTIVALWRYIRREVSLIWIFAGSAASYFSMLPGILILANLADIRQAAGYRSWTYFMPYPATAILFFALSLLVWLWQAYEDAREPEKSSGSTHDDADKKQT